MKENWAKYIEFLYTGSGISLILHKLWLQGHRDFSQVIILQDGKGFHENIAFYIENWAVTIL